VNQIVNLTIKDSIVQRSNLLNSCDIEGNCTGNVVIENSVVQRSTIGKQTPTSKSQEILSCQTCGAELFPNSKFCHICGEKIISQQSTSGLPNKQKEVSKMNRINRSKVRSYLVAFALDKQTVTYKEFKDHFELPYMIQAFNHLKQISNECIENEEPLLSALVVNEDGLPGKGFWDDKISEYLNYHGSATDLEAREIHQHELQNVFSWNWK
jgi:hypothetical protein